MATELLDTLVGESTEPETLRERAALAVERAMAEHLRVQAERDEKVRTSALAELRNALFHKLSLGLDDYTIQDEGDEFIATTTDGLTFSYRDDGHDFVRRRTLHLACECARRCGKPVWSPVFSVTDVGRAILHEAHVHSYDCLVRYNDEGDPITDRDGNPLVPRQPQPTPRELANRAVVDVLAAAKQVGEAVKLVQTLEDERPARKSAAIRRLMQTENPETSKPHSASSAEKIVETDEEYAAFRRLQGEAEVAKHEAFGNYEAAKLSARLEVEACVTLERGNRNE